ncbi:MAG: hypothetical protein R3B13_37540 [Polyangiaceae bacterium]
MTEVESAFGREFSSELFRVFVAVATHVASNMRQCLASGQFEDRVALAAIFHSLRTTPDIGPPLELLRNVGAGPEFVADVMAAHAAWQPVLPAGASHKVHADFAVLLTDLPRLRNGERRRRRTRRRQRT